MARHKEITQADKVLFDFARTGRGKKTYNSVCRSLGALTRENMVSRFKIGKTNDPFGRFKREYARLYAELLVVYRTRSRGAAADMEKRLIDQNWEYRRCDNWASGGGGHVGERGPYYVYVVIRYRRKRRPQPSITSWRRCSDFCVH